MDTAAKLHVGRTDDSDAGQFLAGSQIGFGDGEQISEHMRISCTRSFNFPKPDYSLDHPLFPEVAKDPNGFRIGAGETKDAPEWIMQNWLFEIAKKDGLLVVLESGEPQLEWRLPESVEGNPAYSRDLAVKFGELQRLQDSLVPSKSSVGGLVAYSKSGGAEGSGIWELYCGSAHIQGAFAEIGARGSKALGVSSVDDPLSCWLSQTWLYLRTGNDKQKHTCRTATDSCILGVIEASAQLCWRLALQPGSPEELVRPNALRPISPLDLIARSASILSRGADLPGSTRGNIVTHSGKQRPTADKIPQTSGARRAKPSRRNAKYEAIDKTLCEIADSRPSTQAEVFQSLEGRVGIPPAEPFLAAGGWMAGFRQDTAGARAWLSKRWAESDLPPLPRGPKNSKK